MNGGVGALAFHRRSQEIFRWYTKCLNCWSVDHFISVSSRTVITFSFNFVTPGQALHSPKLHIGSGGLHMILAKQWWYVGTSGICIPNIISLTFWCIVHTHTECEPLAPAKMQCLGRSSANLENQIFCLGRFCLNSWYTSPKLLRTSHFWICRRLPSFLTKTKSFLPGITRLMSSDSAALIFVPYSLTHHISPEFSGTNFGAKQ